MPDRLASIRAERCDIAQLIGGFSLSAASQNSTAYEAQPVEMTSIWPPSNAVFKMVL